MSTLKVAGIFLENIGSFLATPLLPLVEGRLRCGNVLALRRASPAILAFSCLALVTLPTPRGRVLTGDLVRLRARAECSGLVNTILTTLSLSLTDHSHTLSTGSSQPTVVSFRQVSNVDRVL